MSLQEDRSQVRRGNAAHVLASLNNVVIGLAAHAGEANLAEAQRAFGYRFDKAMHYSNYGRPVSAPGSAAGPTRRPRPRG